ncbi:tRNA (adenosine(37)-N6)-threonylcarbamoyltransferase complex transferase subunit TsaD [Candidatus Chloroploca asiatica]|uniref:tRNA N6-adenosine threonylcarbamoyltransferase n=1 Tax=Candidatus Chloroploca asiatica TaxID=1506545 RepID=A0A2H3LEC4_9CHLR|nr:tRNA (adenosine(37)-N6)-threonylcarbamoyltransferase complex transferase subunit TsaD [Candidatus Chloroploca asiatica]PDW01056.1 tRNA N6-adenosine(37)-threonylcarbamoyltransferase complex transferase subunit TsaD [Candidatus Chloroploca asiatica]
MTVEPKTILALETSCDETAAAVVQGGRRMLSNVVASQMAMHQRFGGVVPEVASRQHILSLMPVVERALEVVPGGWEGIDAIAATYGPGLSGALLTGLNAAKAMAWHRGLPFVGVNHLEAHIYANWLLEDPRTDVPAPEFPLVALVVSGGHTLLALLRDHGDYELLGQTRDDAAGEAFDKVARMLDLGYPGGPAIQHAAQGGTSAMTLPRAWLRDSFDFSFSGLKTAVLHRVQERRERDAQLLRPSSEKSSASPGQPPPSTPTSRPQPQILRGKRSLERSREPTEPTAPVAPAPKSALDPRFVGQMAHAFQESVVDVLTTKTVEAATRYNATAILVAGGVAANVRLREELSRRASVPVHAPSLALCTDNAAMVAAAAFYRFHAGLQSGWDLDVVPSLRLGQ